MGGALKYLNSTILNNLSYGHYLYAYAGVCTLSFNFIDLARTPAEEPRSRRPIPTPIAASVLSWTGTDGGRGREERSTGGVVGE